MGPPPKTCGFKPLRNPTFLECGFYTCYFSPHDSGQHPKPLHIFHPCRLAPCGHKPHENIRWCPLWVRKEKKNQPRAIRCIFDSVDPIMLKNPLGVGWGLLPTLWWGLVCKNK